ncbi:MAG TPA: hypothetical protein VF796_12585 [Humisphaera sp.]
MPLAAYEACQREHRRPRDSTAVGPSFALPDDPAAVEAERRRLAAGGCCGRPSGG